MKKQHVIIADDEPVNRLLLKIILEFYEPVKNNIKIYEANDGLEAIALTKDLVEKQKTPSLIFMDWRMPYLNGLETTKKIKKEYNNIPIILYSAYSDVEKTLQDYKEFDDVLEKPLNRSKLNQIVDKYIK